MMNFDHIIDIETPDGHRYLVTPAHVFGEGHHTDVVAPPDLVSDRGDFGFATGRFVQFDDGSNTAFNRNGNMFAPKDYINDAAKLVRYTPLNMLHRKQHVIGTFVGTSVVDPHGALKDAADAAAAKLPFPWIDALAAIWKYHYRDEWALINKAYDQGSCYLSMEAVAQSLTCFTPGCGCDGATFDYMGITSPSYCDSLQQPRARKRLNYPHFVGGAMVVPPAMPAWRRADITHLAATLEGHPDQAEFVYEQIAASASHLEPREWEFIMALVLANAFDEDNSLAEINQADVDRIFACLVPELKSGEVTDEYVTIREARQAYADAEAAAGELVAAGLAAVAKDSGRVLMLQRAVDVTDPASGMWEFPGGHIDPGETALDAAKREWCEELGCDLPDGTITGTWMSPNGIYQGFVYLVDGEADVKCNMDPENRSVLNPDDPDADNAEVAAWFEVDHLAEMPALRAECKACTDWEALIASATDPEVADGIPKDDANYRVADVGDDDDAEPSCATCGYFDAMTKTCELVAGDIDPDWVSDLYTPIPEGREVEPLAVGVERN